MQIDYFRMAVDYRAQNVDFIVENDEFFYLNVIFYESAKNNWLNVLPHLKFYLKLMKVRIST